MSPTVHILILAAGASSRMRGVDKLLQPIDGQPILRRVALTALATGMPVVVALPLNGDARGAALEDLAVATIAVPDATEGMSRSLVRGVASISATARSPNDGVMILPADMPGFSEPALSYLIHRYQSDPHLIWRGATAEGQSGHPAIFPRELWPDLLAVTGDEGGRSVLKAYRDRIRVIALPGQMAVLDLDTPEDWAAYRGHPS